MWAVTADISNTLVRFAVLESRTCVYHVAAQMDKFAEEGSNQYFLCKETNEGEKTGILMAALAVHSGTQPPTSEGAQGGGTSTPPMI
jgi:hypothetical protein